MSHLTAARVLAVLLFAAAGCGRIADDSPETIDQASFPLVESSTRQFAPRYLKNWPLNWGNTQVTQWTTYTVENPNPTPVSVSFTVHRADGTLPPLGMVTKTIPAYGRYGSYLDSAWNVVADSQPSSDPTLSRSSGWIELTASQPVVATARLAVRQGNTPTSPVILLDDQAFLRKPAARLLSNYYLKRWPTGDGRYQWTDITLNNPNAAPAQVTVRIHKRDGTGELASFPAVVPARGLWGSYGQPAWNAIPDSDTLGGIGWIEVVSNLPIVASQRLLVTTGPTRTGTASDSPIALVDEIPFEAAGHYVVRAHAFQKGGGVGGTSMTQWTNLLVANPNPAPANITIVVRDVNGVAASPITAQAPAMGTWNSFNRPEWNNVPVSAGWVELRSDQPVIGTTRVTFRNGTTPTSPVALVEDEVLTTVTARQQHGWIYLRNVGSNITGVSQWSQVAVMNPRTTPVSITVRVMRDDGTGDVLPAFTRTIAAGAMWSSFNDPSWFPDSVTTTGWVEVTSNAPVFGFERITLRQGTTPTSPVVLFDDTLLDANVARERDFLVSWISREPAIDYVWGSSNPAVEGWPAIGSMVTWRAHVRNKSLAAANAVPYRWMIGTTIVATGSVNLPAEGMATVDLHWPWSFNRSQIRFLIDPYNGIPEAEEGNNDLTIDSDAISAGLWVEQSVFDYFDEHQHELMAGSNSWEDWAQRQARTWNQMFASSVYPEAPGGVLDRIRLDKIVVVPDGALPLAGGAPTNHPDLNDRSVDLQWGFPITSSLPSFYADHETQSQGNPFYYEASLLHELGHARYLIDVYGFNVHVNAESTIDITEGGANIVGSPYLPRVSPDAVHYTPYTGLMNGNGPLVDRPSAVALNLIEGRRATLGNYNAPGNLGVFLNDLPAQNRVSVRDLANNPLPFANVRIFQAGPGGNAWYTKHFDAYADQWLNADASGAVLVGHCPFSFSASCITHGYGYSNGAAIVRVQYGSRVGYGFLESLDFNLEYWRGHTAQGEYVLKVNLVP